MEGLRPQAPAVSAVAPDALNRTMPQVVYAGAGFPGGSFPGGSFPQQSPIMTTRMPVTVVARPGGGNSFVAPPPRAVMAAQPQPQPQPGQPGVVVTARGYPAGPGVVQVRGPSFVAGPPAAAIAGMPQARGPSFVAAPPQPPSVVVVGSATAPGSTAGTLPAVAPPQVVTYAPRPMAPVTQPAPVVARAVVAAVPVPAPAPAPGLAPPPPVQVQVPEVKPAPSASEKYVAALEKRIADLEIVNATKTHSAFVFIKPHAVTDKAKQLVRDSLKAAGIFVLEEGSITAEDIDEKKLIDTHYGAIAAKAVTLMPSEMTVQESARDKFEALFEMSWEEALEQGCVFNAVNGAEALGITTEELAAKWDGLQRDVDMVKFGGGFYCGKVDDVFVVNGFYLAMRGKFTEPGKTIHYFLTEWDARALSWADFRGRILGATDPSAAEPNSLRNTIFTEWESLGLASCPDTGDNGVHASASPFEALAERANWLRKPIESDFFGSALLASGLPLSTIQEWCSDPIVTFEGKEQSLFDVLEDTNARECLSRASAIVSEN